MSLRWFPTPSLGVSLSSSPGTGSDECSPMPGWPSSLCARVDATLPQQFDSRIIVCLPCCPRPLLLVHLYLRRYHLGHHFSYSIFLRNTVYLGSSLQLPIPVVAYVVVLIVPTADTDIANINIRNTVAKTFVDIGEAYQKQRFYTWTF